MKCSSLLRALQTQQRAALGEGISMLVFNEPSKELGLV